MRAQKLALAEKIVATFGQYVKRYNHFICIIVFIVACSVFHQAPRLLGRGRISNGFLSTLVTIQLDYATALQHGTIL